MTLTSEERGGWREKGEKKEKGSVHIIILKGKKRKDNAYQWEKSNYEKGEREMSFVSEKKGRVSVEGASQWVRGEKGGGGRNSLRTEAVLRKAF